MRTTRRDRHQGAEPPALLRADRTSVWVDGRKLSFFSGCDYYRLASHPEVLRAAAAAQKRYGLSVSASRMTTGNHELYQRLEHALTDFFQAESALLMPTGYAGATAVTQALTSRVTHALIDEKSHACLFDAARFLNCPVFVFKHRKPESLEIELRKVRDQSCLLLLTDGMFAHDGSAAPLREYRSILPRTALMLVDDAHGAGVLGDHGRGTPERERLKAGAGLIQTITLSKAFGAYGGAVLCARTLRSRMLERSRVFIGSTPIPLPLAAAALRSLEIIAEDKLLRRRLHNNTAQLRAGLRAQNIDAPDAPGPIVRLGLVPSTISKAAQELRRQSILPPVISYFGSTPALRFVVSSQHTGTELKRVIQALSVSVV